MNDEVSALHGLAEGRPEEMRCLGNSNDDDSSIMEYTQHMQFADLKGEFKVEVIMA